MKVIDLYLAIERNKNIPKKVVYKYKTYRYYPEYKQYYREEYGDKISLFLETTMDDKVYLIEDTPKENKKIEKLLLKEAFSKKLNTNLSGITNFKYYYDNVELGNKINEIIDKINKGE